MSASGGRQGDTALLTGVAFEARAQSGAIDQTVIPPAAIGDHELTRAESKTLSGVNQSVVTDPTVELTVLVDFRLRGTDRTLSASGPC